MKTRERRRSFCGRDMILCSYADRSSFFLLVLPMVAAGSRAWFQDGRTELNQPTAGRLVTRLFGVKACYHLPPPPWRHQWPSDAPVEKPILSQLSLTSNSPPMAD
ncbi:unnamed protein product [Ectocarpus sp. 6 AP-2014]